jgi:hypothetical protein
MKTVTGTLLGTLLLAGSTTAALAVGPSQDTLSGKNAPTSSTTPSAQVGQTQNQSQNQGQQAQNQPAQSKPNTTENMWSQDLASRQPGQSGTSTSGGTMAQGQNSQSQNSQSQKGPGQGTAAGTTSRSAATTGNHSMHRHAARSAAKTDETGDRMTDALNVLSADGYFNIQSLTPQGDQFIANATQNGRNVSVLVDPQSGKVTHRS